ncbi:flagellar basal body-associated FliL family protein [Cellvibrio polysaccharolyticus]|uniref:Flagellar protein FliL n=1 Tax=Cellvibrio polysaccharolyticus TaxID=2082724 RepID=A0A928V464_9GAMM|nr:flagellar basal body-associated FliL family protein [Cellvibrio polysaccharolyticus]MBE8715804.1 flagellar basal body-associated protein FliL [Cellvibrio polysaccharolyticus]
MPLPRIIVILLLINTLILVGGITLVYTLIQPLQAGAQLQPAADGSVPVAKQPNKEYKFFPINKIIISLQEDGREHYFVMDLVLQTAINEDSKKLEQIDPMVRNSVVAHLSGLPFSQLRAMPIADLQTTLEEVLTQDFANRNLAQPFAHVLVSKLIVQ